ncbi:NUDIX hydrolase [Parasediminibacterium sp. JCM 36343]|uniref:NUDIX hydrolase n=1 Tax=Parasediminibacterium sp. JCM 36343 TaxID=3374279 RepID=UPI00397CE61A
MQRDLTWKTLASEYLLKDTWATIRIDTCQKPDGVIIAPYYVYEFPNWVTAVPFTKDGRIILERQYRHALGETMYEIPGGCVDPSDKNFEEAIARELLEETGYKFDSFEYLGKTSANPSTNTNLMHMFIAYGGEEVQGQELDHGEDLEVLIVTMEEFIELFEQGAFMQSMHVTCIYNALRKIGKLQLI